MIFDLRGYPNSNHDVLAHLVGFVAHGGHGFLAKLLIRDQRVHRLDVGVRVPGEGTEQARVGEQQVAERTEALSASNESLVRTVADLERAPEWKEFFVEAITDISVEEPGRRYTRGSGDPYTYALSAPGLGLF